MRVTLTTDGGLAYFPGLARPSVLDTATLAPDQAAELARLVSAADFFDRPEVASPPPGAADYRMYTLTIVDGARTRTLRLTDMTADSALRNLLAFVQGPHAPTNNP